MRNYDDIPKQYWDDEPKRRVDGTDGNEPAGRTKIERKKDGNNSKRIRKP